MKWIEQYLANYEGKSKEAKSLEGLLKTLFNGSSYLSWAVMERITYTQDPEANFKVVETKEGDILHTSQRDLETFNSSGDKTIETRNSMFSHFVIVNLTFLGKTFEEVYPVLGKKYDAPKVVDAHLVNKALQRAKAKVASRATGLGLKLYEGLDLQFDDAKKTTHKKAKIVVDVTTEPVDPVGHAKEGNILETKEGVNKLVAFIQGNEGAEVALQKVNTSVAKKYGFTISKDDVLNYPHCNRASTNI